MLRVFIEQMKEYQEASSVLKSLMNFVNSVVDCVIPDFERTPSSYDNVTILLKRLNIFSGGST